MTDAMPNTLATPSEIAKVDFFVEEIEGLYFVGAEVRYPGRPIYKYRRPTPHWTMESAAAESVRLADGFREAFVDCVVSN